MNANILAKIRARACPPVAFGASASTMNKEMSRHFCLIWCADDARCMYHPMGFGGAVEPLMRAILRWVN